MSSMLRTIRRRAEREGHVKVSPRARRARGKRRQQRFEARIVSKSHRLDPLAAMQWVAAAMRKSAMRRQAQ